MTNRASIAFVAMLLALVTCHGYGYLAAWGHDADQPNAAWFNSLRQPSTGNHCCGIADCRAYNEQTEVRINDGVYTVLHNGEWLTIDDDKFIPGTNPTGALVACVHDNGAVWTVLCAVKGTGT